MSIDDFMWLFFAFIFGLLIGHALTFLWIAWPPRPADGGERDRASGDDRTLRRPVCDDRRSTRHA